MSYNVTNWTTKRIKNLVIPFSALYNKDVVRKDWLPEQPKINPDTQEIVITCGCGQEIKGTFADETKSAVRVTEFDMHGEGSGSFWHECLRQALEKSTGTLEAVIIYYTTPQNRVRSDWRDRLKTRRRLCGGLAS